MIELQILAAILANRSAYDTFTQYGDGDSFSPTGRLLAEAVGDYYGRDADVQSCDRQVICERVARSLSNPKHEAAFRDFVQGIPRDVSVSNVRHELTALRRERIGLQLSLAIANKSDAETIAGLYRDYGNVIDGHGDNEGDSSAELIDPFDVTDLESDEEEVDDRIKLWPEALNLKCRGGARRGHSILIFARPEAGKTAFTINMCVGFLKQGLSVLYVGNEEPGRDIVDRMRARMLKSPLEKIQADRKRAAEEIKKRGKGGHLRILEGTPGSFRQIERILKKKSYDVLVLDQIRNISVKADTKVGELEEAAKSARALAKKYGLVAVSVTQAGNSAQDKVYLGMSDVDNSKTGMPAAYDLMIGVGSDDGMKLAGLMGISLPKNKLSGDHTPFTVSADFRTGVIV